MTSFDHFPPEAVQFLRDLKANNTRDWFAAQKPDYEAFLKAPGQAFARAVEMGLEARPDLVARVLGAFEEFRPLRGLLTRMIAG